jgi:hypothetical protein
MNRWTGLGEILNNTTDACRMGTTGQCLLALAAMPAIASSCFLL